MKYLIFSANGNGHEDEDLSDEQIVEEEDLFVNGDDNSLDDTSDTEAELFNSPSSSRYSKVIGKVGLLANTPNPSRQDLSKGKSQSLIRK